MLQIFLCNTDDQQDKHFWDSVLRYSVSRQEMTKARLSGELLMEKMPHQHGCSLELYREMGLLP